MYEIRYVRLGFMAVWSTKHSLVLKGSKMWESEKLVGHFLFCQGLDLSEVLIIFDMSNVMCMAQVWGNLVTGPGFGLLAQKCEWLKIQERH